MTQESPKSPRDSPPEILEFTFRRTGNLDYYAHKRRRKQRFQLGILVILLGILIWGMYQGGLIELPHRAAYRGLSSGLQQTVIVPTIDSPMPSHRNVIWCSSFQLAWNQARDHIFKAPIQLAKEPLLARRLNTASSSDADLAPASVYTTAGFVKDDIVNKIHQEMARKFPGISASELPPTDSEGLVMYSYLPARVQFALPFHLNRDTFQFTDAQDRATAIRSFGILPFEEGTCGELRKQVKVLYRDDYLVDNQTRPTEYALDLCRTSQPYQIVVASIPPKESLAETWKTLQADIAAMPPVSESKPDKMEMNDSLLVPEMQWSIRHHFVELEGNKIINQHIGMISKAEQVIDFQLDRSGAGIVSIAGMVMGCTPADYLFNHPYLLYMQRRGAKTPFFIMWVDNAELMDK